MKFTTLKTVSLFLVISLIYQIVFPTIAYALTGGPSQPEVQSFEPAGTTEMVDLFSGDFNYNIPLMDVEGYPINISYHSGITMDQEASWVGLGWNINPGAINRSTRGVPDDFSGDAIKHINYMKPNRTVGVNAGMTIELFGAKIKKAKGKFAKKLKPSLTASVGVSYNNYKGVGVEMGITPAISAGDKFKYNGSLSISGGNQKGLNISPSTGFSLMVGANGKRINGVGVGLSVSSSFNSRTGSKTLSFSRSTSLSLREGKSSTDEAKKKARIKGEGVVTASNGGSSISFASETVSPNIGVEMNGINLSLKAAFGIDIQGADPTISLSGFYSSQYIPENKQRTDKYAYGYLYEEQTLNVDDENVLHDFNREKDASYSENSPVLPITNLTYDVYAVNGQGIGGVYRPHRSDIAKVSDSYHESKSGGGSIGAEFNVGSLTKFGMDILGNWTKTSSSKWKEDNGLANTLGWSRKQNGLHEPVYFKNAGEKTEVDESFIAYKNLDVPLRPAFNHGEVLTIFNGRQKRLLPELSAEKMVKGDGDERENSNTTSIVSTDKRVKSNAREKRNQVISFLTVEESVGCVQMGVDGLYGKRTKNSQAYGRSPKHIVEITALNSSGQRYVYGLPAYNTSQKEVTMAVRNKSENIRCEKGLTSYNSHFYDVKKGDDGTTDEFYNEVQTPPFAHSYLITDVLSPDFVDVTNNGPTDDDLGTYTHFSYEQAHGAYKWRTPSPMQKNIANYIEGNKTDLFDDKASFIYGTKEVWYLTKIETKNYVAIFNLEEREDGLGVLNEHGGIDSTQKLKRIKSIQLFSKGDYYSMNVPIPIKTVHFEYDYSLCPGVPNNIQNVNGSSTTAGKLTLKRIYFTYGNSNKSRFNEYKFNYPANFNKSYNAKGYDRWGNYAPANSCVTNESGGRTITSSWEHPYVDQSASSGTYWADDYAQSWTLNEIELPSGGKITVEYEADDYAYVQNRRAMQMFRVVGFGKANGSPSESLRGDSRTDQYDAVFVKLNSPCPNIETFKREYLPEPQEGTGKRNLFFNVFVNIGKVGSNNYEYVRGYATISNDAENCGLKDNGMTAWIKLDLVDVDERKLAKDIEVNPIAFAAWQHGKLYTPYIVFPGSDKKTFEPLDMIRYLSSFFIEIANISRGFNRRLLGDGYGRQIKAQQSWVRLNNPDKKKKGGGLRVKRILISDEWNEMTGLAQQSASYGQEYDYTTAEGGRVISSGVASYEPMIGGEENPFKQPVVYSKENSLIPDDNFYAEEPFGESFFPGASVGYSKVTVKPYIPSGVNVKKHNSGYMVHEFYTTKDFPTITKRTNLQKVIKEPNWLTGLFMLKIRKRVMVVQGYQIELNDMNGKPKANWNYAEQNTGTQEVAKMISGQQFIYLTNSEKPWILENRVKVARKDGSVVNALVGVEADLSLDTKEQKSKTQSAGAEANTNLVLAGFLPFPIPIILPSYSSEETVFRSAVLTRVINRYGLLVKTIAYSDQSTIATTNEIFDAETGNVLVTKTQNEYSKTVASTEGTYNTIYPAHWMYDGLGMAYQNIGAQLKREFSGNMIVNVPSTDDVFKLCQGDIVLVSSANTELGFTPKLMYVSKVNGFVKVTDYINTSLDGEFTIKIIKSGHKNMSELIALQSQSILNPDSSGKIMLTSGRGILQSFASVFNDKWPTLCIGDSVTDRLNTCYLDKPKFEEWISALNYVISTGVVDFNSIGVSVNTTFNPSPPSVFTSTFLSSYLLSSGIGYQINYSAYEGMSMLFLNFGIPLKKNAEGVVISKVSLSSSGAIEMPFGLSLSNFLTSYKLDRVQIFDYRNSRNYYHETASGTGVPSDKLISLSQVKIKYTFKQRSGSKEAIIIQSGDIFIPKDAQSSRLINQEGCILEPNSDGNIETYISNVVGNWKKKKDYLYLTNRMQKGVGMSVRRDGIFEQYRPFWRWNSTAQKWEADELGWTWKSEVTLVNPATGDEMETKDALGRYDAALFDYRSKPVAVANNAQRREIGAISFEEQNGTQNGSCGEHHWKFKTATSGHQFDQTVSHTGFASIRMSEGAYPLVNHYLTQTCSDFAKGDTTCLVCETCVTPFNPFRNKKYLLSGWVKVKTSTKQMYVDSIADLRSSAQIVFTLNTGANVVHNIKPTGAIIDGWQRFSSVVTVPSNSQSMDVYLKASTMPGSTTWYDDLRIHPYDANMKTFVYHPTTYRLMSELDENNYASFYEYDSEGQLIRVKKETERGIMTVKEHRKHMLK